MTETKNFEIRQTPASIPLTFDSQKCIGCNRCLEACQMDLMIPGEEKGTHPLVIYPDECWYCGCCVMECPADAVKLHHPLMNQTRWVTKESLLGGK